MTKQQKRKEFFQKRLKRDYINLIRKAKTADQIHAIVYHCVFDKDLSLEDMTAVQAVGEYVTEYMMKGGFRH